MLGKWHWENIWSIFQNHTRAVNFLNFTIGQILYTLENCRNIPSRTPAEDISQQIYWSLVGNKVIFVEENQSAATFPKNEMKKKKKIRSKRYAVAKRGKMPNEEWWVK